MLQLSAALRLHRGGLSNAPISIEGSERHLVRNRLNLINLESQIVKEQPSDRREFMKRAASSLPIVAAASSIEAEAASKDPADLYQPEDFWRQRMEAPGDGKKLGWFVDTRRCFGCHAREGTRQRLGKRSGE